MSEPKKIYVNSGAMQWVGHACGPIDAIKKALATHGSGGALDSTHIFLDERGFRNKDAQYKVPVEQALAEAGYIFEDESADTLDDFSPSVEE